MSDSARAVGSARQGVALGQSFDDESCSLVVVPLSPAVRYLATRPDGARIAKHVRQVIADEDSPRVTDPMAAPVLVYTDSAGVAEVVFHVEIDLTTVPPQQADVEVWVRSAITPGATPQLDVYSWLHVATVPNVVPFHEYRFATGYRVVFLRLTNTAGLGAPAPATVRAAGV